jgi:uncharacterized protein (DUF849 family)
MMGMTAEQRMRAIQVLKPELATCNFGSLNFALFQTLDIYNEFKFTWEEEYLAASEHVIFPNTFKMLREMLPIFEQNDTQPELEIYDIGMINNVAFMLNKGYLKKPVYLQFVMGILGGIQPTPGNLLFMYNSARELIGDFNWSVCAAGRQQFNMCTIALIQGGNARVGLEDNLYLEKGVKARSNGEQVAKIVRISRELGLEPATPDEARQILGLKGPEKVSF